MTGEPLAWQRKRICLDEDSDERQTGCALGNAERPSRAKLAEGHCPGDTELGKTVPQGNGESRIVHRGGVWLLRARWSEVRPFRDQTWRRVEQQKLYGAIFAFDVRRGGYMAFFWTDLWNLLHLQNPQLFSFAKNDKQTVAQVCSEDDFQSLFHFPLSIQAYDQYQGILDLVQGLEIADDEDHWEYIWNNAIYSLVKVYELLMGAYSSSNCFQMAVEEYMSIKAQGVFLVAL